MIPFNKPFFTGDELGYIHEAHKRGQLSGDGFFTKKCSKWLEQEHNTKCALLTHSCTGALEMAAILCDLKPGDEIILPSYTFVSSANAFILRGAVPVFVDIRSDNLNIDEKKIESAITDRTKAILVVHYAGVACEMDIICEIARARNLYLIEDAAQAIQSKYKSKPLGSIGDLGCISFHETKNIISGEGGALLINNEDMINRAKIIREKGTNRSLFFEGKVDKYSWVDIGSSYLPGELISAFLWAQLNHAKFINSERRRAWDLYHFHFKQERSISCPVIHENCDFNAHIYYMILPENADRKVFITECADNDIQCVFHYVPLHSSIGGKKFSRANGQMINTNSLSSRLVRLPLWIGIESDIPKICETISNILN